MQNVVYYWISTATVTNKMAYHILHKNNKGTTYRILTFHNDYYIQFWNIIFNKTFHIMCQQMRFYGKNTVNAFGELFKNHMAPLSISSHRCNNVQSVCSTVRKYNSGTSLLQYPLRSDAQTSAALVCSSQTEQTGAMLVGKFDHNISKEQKGS